MNPEEMMKKIAAAFILFLTLRAGAQNGEDLMVYSIKGTVTVIENNKETKARIGKLLKPGAVIRTARAAKMTMVCKQGKPLSVIKEGSYPVVRWKDSCTADHHSVSARYFQFVWDQLYVRSDEYRKKHPDAVGAVVRDDAPVRGQEELEITSMTGADTLEFAGGDFYIGWQTNQEFTGMFLFTLRNAETGETLLEDSTRNRFFLLTRLRKYLRHGITYSWSVSVPRTTAAEEGFLRYWPVNKRQQQVRTMQQLVKVPEEPAAGYFRTAYLLENEYWLADAWNYYRKAVKAAPAESFFREQLQEFEIKYKLNRNRAGVQ